MNLRSLSPFLISLAFVLGTLGAPVWAIAQETSAPAPSAMMEEQILAEVGQQLKTHYDWDGDLQITLLRPFTAPAPSAEPIDVVVTDYPNTISSTLLIRVSFKSAGATLSEVSLSVRVQLWRDAWVTRQPVNRGASIDAAELDVRRIDALRERDSLSASLGMAEFSYARGVQAGRVLTWRDVAKRLLVRKGEIVEVSASDGQLTITMKALAMQNGSSGDIVLVRNLESKKEISGQVVAENRVRVRF